MWDEKDSSQATSLLYSIDEEGSSAHILNSSRREKTLIRDFLKGMYYGSNEARIQSPEKFDKLAEFIEPLYDSFFCPLTKKMMEDPVTIETGLTFERKAIAEWFENLTKESKEIVCPLTMKELKNQTLNTNVALCMTIEEWRDRNEATRIRIARTALSMASTTTMMVDAIKDLKLLCAKREKNRLNMHKAGITEMMATFVEHRDEEVRCEALSILSLLSEDEFGKEIIAKTKAAAIAITMLSGPQSQERQASSSLLVQLSKSEPIREYISSFPFAIQTLITLKSETLLDPATACEAEEILRNLERSTKGIKCMAIFGYLDPLIRHLINGCEDMQVEMANYLGELTLRDDISIFVAQRVSYTLSEMVDSKKSTRRNSALKALVRISNNPRTTITLIDAGIVPKLIKEIFARDTFEAKHTASGIIANILESGVNPKRLLVDEHSQVMASNYIIYNIACMLLYSNPEDLNTNLVRILVCLTMDERTLAMVATMLKDTEACNVVVEFLNSPTDELVVASGKLLIRLSCHMGHTISEGICKNIGRVESIMGLDAFFITKKHAVVTNLLARLPRWNQDLDLALIHDGAVPVIIERIHEILSGEESDISRNQRHFVEGLVGILLKITTALSDPDILLTARQHKLTSVFSKLLACRGSSEVRRLAAIGLKNLTFLTPALSKQEPRIINGVSVICRCFPEKKEDKNKQKKRTCAVHSGTCSPTTFCLVETGAVEGLLGCLEDDNAGVVEAALDAIETFMDGEDVEGSAAASLGGAKAVARVVDSIRAHRKESVNEKAFRVMERLLRSGSCSSSNGGLAAFYSLGDRTPVIHPTSTERGRV